MAHNNFLYRHVATELRNRIETGQYQRGSAIPSQAKLVKEFGVSPITIRRAIRDLAIEGVLYGHQGRGVFVADTRRIVRMLGGRFGRSLGDEIQRAGFTPSIKEIAFNRISPDTQLRRLFHLRSGMWLNRHEKLIYADDVPIALDIVHLPKGLSQELRERLRQQFVFAALHELKIEVGRIDFTFESTLASDEEAKRLNLSPRFPLIVARYVVANMKHKPILEGYTASRADRMSFQFSANSILLGSHSSGASGKRANFNSHHTRSNRSQKSNPISQQKDNHRQRARARR